MAIGAVPTLSITPGPLVGIYQAPIQNAWNLIVQQLQPGQQMQWSQGGNFLYVPLPGLQQGETLVVWAQVGIKGAQVYTGRVAVGGGVNIAQMPMPQDGGLPAPAPPSSVGEDWNSDMRPYLELAMQQAFVVPSAGDWYAYMRCYAAVDYPAPAGYLQAMWPHGSILVHRYGHN